MTSSIHRTGCIWLGIHMTSRRSRFLFFYSFLTSFVYRVWLSPITFVSDRQYWEPSSQHHKFLAPLCSQLLSFPFFGSGSTPSSDRSRSGAESGAEPGAFPSTVFWRFLNVKLGSFLVIFSNFSRYFMSFWPRTIYYMYPPLPDPPCICMPGEGIIASADGEKLETNVCKKILQPISI